MTGPVARAYRTLLAAGELKPDRDQQRAVAALDRLARDLARPSGGLIDRLFGRSKWVFGVYLWGGVGRGKSMLMDLAFDHIPIAPKTRVHFHAFMLDVHQRLRAARAEEKGDPIPIVAQGIAAQARLLCFDEMVINNTADAMILSRLFTALLEEGVAVVTTSNRPPTDLYMDGLNRELFLPFIALIGERMQVIPLNGPTDYRLDRLEGVETWHVPNGEVASEAMSRAFFQLTDFSVEDRARVPSEELALPGGRTLHVPQSLTGVAVFSFKRLCGEARGAADYLAIAQRFHTVFLVGVPVMTPEMRNEAARFATLVDALYEHKVKLIAAADTEPPELYPAGTGAFEFGRTASRLEEMKSADYLAEGHGLTG